MPRAASPWAIYVRQSLDRSGEGLAVERQETECRQLAKRLGLNGSPVVYADNDTSASTAKPRPAYERLMTALAAGQHAVLLAWHPDRLHRRPVELERFIDVIESNKVSIHTVQNGDYRLDTPDGRMVARMLGAAARREVEHKGERQRSAIKQKAEKGRRHGGGRSFGYGQTISTYTDNDGTQRYQFADIEKINPTEAAAIRTAFDAILRGQSTTSIWKRWNERGLLTPFGNRWDGTTFRNMMLRPSLAGIVVYGGVDSKGDRKPAVELVDVSAAWPAIVERAKWEAVHEILTDPARKSSPGPTPKHLCGGITFCECGRKMKSAVNSIKSKRTGERSNFPVYRCSAGEPGHSSIKMAILDNAVYAAVIDALWRRRQKPVARVEADDERLAAIALELKAVRKRESRLADAIADELVSAAAARQTSERIKADRAALEEERRNLTQSLASDGAGEAMAAFWEGLDLSQPADYESNIDTAIESVGRDLIHAMKRGGINPAEAKAKLAMEERFDRLPLAQQRSLIASLIRVTVRRGQGAERVEIVPL